MKFVKNVLILLFISFQCNALWSQCVLEKITLPITVQWKLQTASYYNDSSLSIEKWQLLGENAQPQTQSLRIYSIEKNERQRSQHSSRFFMLLQNELNDNRQEQKDSFLTVPAGRKDKYENVRYFIAPIDARQANETGHWKSLRWYINGKTSYHILIIACNEKDFTQSYIDQWKAHFSKARIRKPNISQLQETVFRFQTSQVAEMDSSAIEDLSATIITRLRDIYSRKIEEDQIEVKGKEILIKLFGRIDTAVCSMALKQGAVATNLQIHEVDTSIASIKNQIAQIQNKENFTAVIFSNHINSPAAIGAIRAKDSLAALNLLKHINIPANCMLSMEDKGFSGVTDWQDIFLLRKEPIISGNEIVHCAAQPDFREFMDLIIKLNKDGKAQLADYTKNNIGKYLAILIDGKVLSAPKLVGEIPGGQVALSGSFSVATAYQYLKKIGYPYPVPMYLLSIERK